MKNDDYTEDECVRFECKHCMESYPTFVTYDWWELVKHMKDKHDIEI